MPIALYMDHHVPRAITAGLRSRGVDVLTAYEDGTHETDDSALLDKAGELGRVLFTRDDDLLIEATQRQRAGRPFFRCHLYSPVTGSYRGLYSRFTDHRRGGRGRRVTQCGPLFTSLKFEISMAGRFSLWPYLETVNWGFDDQVFSMPTTTAYVRIDDQEVMRVGKSRLILDSVVAAFTQDHSAETIQQQYPALSLEEVYGAIAWYLANHDEVARYFERQDAIWKHWRRKANRQSSAVVQRLRALQVSKRSEPL